MTKVAKAARLTIAGRVHELDLSRFMFSEAVALEDEWGVNISDLGSQLFSGSPKLRALGALMWMVQVRTDAAELGIPFAEAAKGHPVASFDIDLAGVQLEVVLDEPNPTSPAIRTPATRTTRGTSAKRSGKTAAASSGSAT